MIDDHSQEFLKDLTYDLRKREWDRIGQDFEIILDDCPQNSSRGNGPFSCNGYNFIFKIYLKFHHSNIYMFKNF